jgi:ABC-2 type transport system permease protein
MHRQQDLVRRFQFVSPAIMMQLALNEASGTSAERYEDFLDQAFAFRAEWNGYFAERFLKREPLRPEDYDSFPRFEYRPEPLGAALARVAPSLAGLLLACLAFGIAPVAALRRYEVAAR